MQVGNGGVQALAQLLQLRSLSLHCCRGITDAGLVPLAASLTSLTSLNLSGCCQITGGKTAPPDFSAVATVSLL